MGRRQVSFVLRYGFVGALTSLIYAALYCIAVIHGGVASVPASLAAFTLAILVQYVLHARFTFLAPALSASQFAKFLSAVAAGLCLSTAFAFAGPRLGAHPVLIAGSVAVAAPVFNFILFRGWVFKGAHGGVS